MKHLGTQKLETKRLVLRQIKESDALGIYNSFINEEKFLYYANKEKRTLKEEENSLKGIKEKYKDKEYYNWLITLKDDTIIGSINLNVDNYNESLEFNYAIDEAHQNNGYMTEALAKVKNYALNSLNANRFYGGCEINNMSSQKVMEKTGLSFEGILRNHLKLRDGYHDMLVYAIVNNNKIKENNIDLTRENNYISGIVNMASYNMGPSQMEAVCYNKETFLEEFSKNYRIQKDKIELNEVDIDYKKRLKEMLNVDDKAISKLDYLITTTAGFHIKTFEVTEESFNYMDNPKNYLPFFFLDDICFMEFEKMIICFMTGNFE